VPADRLRSVVLLRIACAMRGTTKTEVAADLAPFASRLPSAPWRAQVEREIEALAAAGLVAVKANRIDASESGLAQAAKFLGLKGDLPRLWADVRDVRLVALALGMQREPAKRLKALAAPDGLRAAIVERAHKLKIKGAVTPARLREALAAIALKRAFGDKSTAALAGKLGLSAKAGRLLAGQLAQTPRDFGTDTRLVAALAAEHVGAASSAADALRMALLQGYFGGRSGTTASAKRAPARRALGKGVPARPEPPAPQPVVERLQQPQPAPPVPTPASTGRPDLTGFASEVRRHAAGQAQGWSGDRKAYISHVWRDIRATRPDWGLSEIEFKCMLAEAHRSGQLALANADLKDKSNIQDVQDSAVVYRNAVFHFIRVDA
jgi:hypothetical protein